MWNFITIRTVIEIFRPGPKFCRDRLADLCCHLERHNWKSGYISIKESGSCESRRLWLIPCQKGNYCSGLRKVAEWHTHAPPHHPFFFVFSGGQHRRYSCSHRFLAAISWDVNTTARRKAGSFFLLFFFFFFSSDCGYKVLYLRTMVPVLYLHFHPKTAEKSFGQRQVREIEKLCHWLPVQKHYRYW